jgi:hypothetical protein
MPSIRSRAFYSVAVAISGLALWVWVSPAKANVNYGVNVTVYNNYGYNASPPVPPNRPVVGTMVAGNIDHSFDQEPLFQMYEDFVVHYDGFITAPSTGNIEFMAQADDGTKFYLDGVLVTDDWVDKGGGGSVSDPVYMVAGQPVPFTLWFYENGGGAWVELWWMHDDQWEIVPASAFTLTAEQTTTTTSTTTTTTTSTTTSTTTTTEAPVPTSTTTEAPAPTVVETTTTVEATTTTVAQTTTSTAVPSTTTTTSSTSTSPPTTLPSPEPTSPTTLPVVTAEPLTDEEFDVFVEALSTASPSEVQETLTVLLEAEITEEQAFELATTPTVIENATAEQAQDIFDAVSVEELTDAQAEALVNIVQDAPTEVREAFEEEINVFNGKTDTYVPLGSVIPVGQRRALIAITAVAMVAPVTIASRRK